MTLLKLTTTGLQTGPDLPLPGLLQTATSRSGAGEIDPLLAGIKVEKVYGLAAASRGGPGEVTRLDTAAAELLALETEDGSTLFIRSDALAEAVARRRPEAVTPDGAVDFAQFRDPNAAARGLGDVPWKLAAVLTLPSDALLAAAKEKALEWAKEKLGEQVEDRAYGLGSFLGAKALMWQIEARLAGRPGLYRWQDKTLDPADRCLPGDPRLQDAAAGRPMLVLIHGFGSYTLGSFAELREDDATWEALRQRFPGGIFGYEHRTFSESPAENALALLDALPRGARISLLTHSRGGLVGDLLCLGQVDDRIIDAYRIDTTDADDVAGLEQEAQEERARLRAIGSRLAAGHIAVERYVRVACPARGTRFLSDNLDAALSDFLNLLQWGGGALVRATATALGGPAAGAGLGAGASSCLGVVKRLVLEIVGRRIDPRLVPGIAAMGVAAPLAAFLAHPATRRRDGIAMAVIAGDTEFDGFGISHLGRRVANLFCDWRLFDGHDNDLVVDTDSMYAGLGFRTGAKYLYDQDASVTHFNYYRNPPTRDALRAWLTADDPAALALFAPLGEAANTPWRDRRPAARRGGAAAPPAVAIVIPGIMGSHIEIDRRRTDEPGSGDRIWFEPVSLAGGGLARIGDPNAANVVAEDLFELFYGDLADHLAASHTVLRCPYDWRRPLAQGAQDLATKIAQAARTHPGQPIRLLAHSMGGLVVRLLMLSHPAAWRQVVASGGRLLMLGTPNNGAHLMVHSLLGKTDSMRMLERIDAQHGLQEILDIVAGFPGALALLPRPGFADSGDEARLAGGEYYRAATWAELKAGNTDPWYGDGIGGTPPQDLLAAAERSWERLPRAIADPERVDYVFGQSARTPCGVQRGADGRLKLLFTPDGDGSVTWASGRLDNLDADARGWYMPVEHADLAATAEHFPAIAELLETGGTDKLDRLPRRRGEAARGFVLEAAPPVVPAAEELARAFLGSGPRRRQASRAKETLKVSVLAGDVRFLDQPVLCGHYIGDAISGAEAALDEMLGGGLAERERLGVYAAEIGSQAIVLRPPNGEERARGSLPGAVIVGLGPFTGQLSARQVGESVRAAVTRFLLQLRDVIGVRPEAGVKLYSLLIGWNSTASISVSESVAATTRGVLEANRQFRDATGKGRERDLAVTELCFVELYRDAAISAAHAVRALPGNLEGELKRLGARLAPAATVAMGDGVLERLDAADNLGHWSRLIVTDADAADVACPAEPRHLPERIKYVFLSQRARAESVVQHRQPGLIETIIRDQRRNSAYDAKLGHTLFQLMVPQDHKATLREQSRLLLVLDGYTANLPWELLQVDGEPLVLHTPLVRQLSTASYRQTVRTAGADTACLIVAPSTAGYDKRFGGAQPELDELAGAVREAQSIRESLRGAGWRDGDIVVSPAGREALDVLNTLYARPYRLLMIGAHGVFEAQGLDGRKYSGVVLSDGLLITAAEIGQMETVPELVFLNCCHQGSIDNPASEPNRLAHSLARELVEIGVRCVVAAGWAVNDDAACSFASSFFDRLCGGATFGAAVFAARQAAYRQHPGSNTWGAYQAYGDPGYRLRPADAAGNGSRPRSYVAVEELLAALNRRPPGAARRQPATKPPSFAQQRQWLDRQLARCPPAWGNRPDVLQAVGAFYGELGADGFEAARQAFLRAIQLEDKSGRVAVQTIEQLANIEARRGYALAEAGQFKPGMALIDSATERLKALADSVKGAGAAETNPERAALWGSALKLKAAALTHKPKPAWTAVAACLDRAAKAYASGIAGDPAMTPYNTLSALPLAWLVAGNAKIDRESAALARRCGETARARFAEQKDFWHAVMSVDAELAAWLHDRSLPDALPTDTPAALAAVLQRRYEQAVETLPRFERRWDSVVQHWRLLARFLRLRATKGDRERAEVLERLADHYGPHGAATT